jgi:hypothetical protein
MTASPMSARGAADEPWGSSVMASFFLELQ